MSLQQQSRSSTPPGGAVSVQQLACSIDLFSFSGGTAAARVLSLELGRGNGPAPDIGGVGSAAGGFGSIFVTRHKTSVGETCKLLNPSPQLTNMEANVSAAAGKDAAEQEVVTTA
eukprot:gene8445-8629_t